MSQQGFRTAREFAADCGDVFTRLACIAAGITGQRDFAEDIVQQAIAIAIEKDVSFESKDQFTAWLAEIVRRCAMNHRRKISRRKTHPMDPTNLTRVETDELRINPIHHESGDLLPLQSSFDDKTIKALQQLSPKARSCLLLRTIENLCYKEISNLMQIPEGTAMSLVHRSKKLFVNCLVRNVRLVLTALAPEHATMTDKKREHDDERRDAFLDHLLTDEEQELFLSESESRQELLSEMELQTKIDESLQRIYRFDRPNENQFTELASKIEFARSGRPNIWRRQNLMRIALAASILLLAGIGIWQLDQNRPTPPVFQPRPLAKIYQDTVERGFKPYYECDDPQRFADVFAMRHGKRLGLAALPEGRRMLGISYLGGLSRKTTAMLCAVDDRDVIVFVENAENDQPNIALANDDPGLNVYSVSKNGLIFYEVTPFRSSQMIDYFEFLD